MSLPAPPVIVSAPAPPRKCNTLPTECCVWESNSYPQALFHRIRAESGAKVAIGAVAASILRSVYHMLENGTFHDDLGADPFERRAKPARIKRLVAKLQALGFEGQINASAA